MSSMPLLQQARQRGWLLVDQPTGPPWDELATSWLIRCWREGEDCVVVYPGVLHCTIHVKHQLTPLGCRDLEAWCARCGFELNGDGLPVRFQVRGSGLADQVEELRGLLQLDRHAQRTVDFDATFPVRQGLAQGPDSDEVMFVREIPGRPGRCVVIRNRQVPRIDQPLSDYRFLSR